MTYKQTLFFVGECLSLVKYPERKKKIARLITSGYVDWDMVVKLSSNQMVVPAVYFNLKNAQLLTLLPEGLEMYFEKITQANRSRNKALIKQANQIVLILNKHNITPLFLKGMAHLLEGLYQDIGERMIGDIDFLVAKNQVDEVAKILKQAGYFVCVESEISENCRHFKRLIHKDHIAAIEIHKEILGQNHKHTLGYNLLFAQGQNRTIYRLPSYGHQALHNMLNAQVNDRSFYEGSILVRQLYDCFLLSFKKDVPKAIKLYEHDYFLKNIYFKWLHKLFKTEFILYKKSLFLNLLMLRYEMMMVKILYKPAVEIAYFSSRFFYYIRQLVLIFKNKNKRHDFIKSISAHGWLKRHSQSYKKGRVRKFK